MVLINYRTGDNFGVAVASPPLSVKGRLCAHIRLRVDVLENFAIEYNLNAHILIRYG